MRQISSWSTLKEAVVALLGEEFDHSIDKASKVDVESVGIFNKRREFHEDE